MKDAKITAAKKIEQEYFAKKDEALALTKRLYIKVSDITEKASDKTAASTDRKPKRKKE